MKALVYHGTKDLRYQDFPDPHAGTGEVLLRIKASGLCHTDFNEYINGPAALSVTRPGGTVCLSGVISHPMQFNWNDVLRDEKTITTTNAYNDEFPIVIAMLNDGRLKAEPLVSQTFPLKEAWSNLTRFEEAGRANIKMLIEMSN